MDKTIYYKSGSRWNAKIIVLILVCFSTFNSCVKESEPVRILFVGDILLSRNVRDEYNSRKTFPWEKLNSLFQSSNLVIGNLEGAVGTSEDQINPKALSPVFAIDSCDIALLSKARFSAMTIENNHSFDLGEKGKNKTISVLNENNIKSISFKNSPYFFNLKENIISIIAINLVLDRDSSKFQIPSIEIKQKLRLARILSNVVIVSIHWGSELLEWPNNQQRKAAKWLIANGADVIIGHHPHVVQQPELIDGKPVYFSLGNHLFDQKYKSSKEGLMAEIIIDNGKIICNGIKTVNQKNSFYPEIKGSTENYFNPIEFQTKHFTINNIQIIPENIDILNKIILKAYSNHHLLWKSHPMSLVDIQKIKIENKNEHLFALESYYSTLDKEINIRPYVYSIDDQGITARWRGSALAWPMIDARISPYNNRILCALHRGDAFISIGKSFKSKKVVAYQWNGFGFNAINDTIACKICEKAFD